MSRGCDWPKASLASECGTHGSWAAPFDRELLLTVEADRVRGSRLCFGTAWVRKQNARSSGSR